MHHHHFLFNSCSALFCVLPNSNTTWASGSTSVPIQNVLSQVQTTFSHVCRLPTHPFPGLLVPARAPCCRIPRTANTQIQELQIPKIITFKTSHTACLHCTCWRKEQEFIGTVKLPTKTHRIHLMFNLVPPSDFTVSYHPTHQYMIKSNFCLVFSLRRLLEMHEAVPELSTTIKFVTV